MFTYNSYEKRAWSCRGKNIEVLQTLSSKKSVAIIAGVSLNRGVEIVHLKPRSITTDGFLDYLLDLRESYGTSSIFLFMDNLSVHKSKRSLEKMQELDI